MVPATTSQSDGPAHSAGYSTKTAPRTLPPNFDKVHWSAHLFPAILLPAPPPPARPPLTPPTPFRPAAIPSRCPGGARLGRSRLRGDIAEKHLQIDPTPPPSAAP